MNTLRTQGLGWVGKPKGALQILFERGWIDPNKIQCYTLKGTGATDGETFSIFKLMQKQSDFKNEESQMKYII